MSVHVVTVDQADPRLGRQLVHDDASRGFAFPGTVDRTTWRDKAIRLYDPWPNPNQRVGCCTGVAKCSQFNAVGNRRKGVVLDLADAEDYYSENTRIDPFPGTWPPDDTGSSGLASAKTAQKRGEGGEYRWLFGGADEVVQAIMSGAVVSVGTWWHWDMFTPNPSGLIQPGGGQAGGHQYVIRGYDADKDWLRLRCWWGAFRDAWISRTHLDNLLRDGGDAHVQRRT